MAIPSPTTRASAKRHVTVADLVTALAMGVVGGLWLSWLDLRDVGAGVVQGPVGHSTTVVAFTVPLVLVVHPVLAASLRRGMGESAVLARCILAVAASVAVGNQLRLVAMDEPRGGLPVIGLFGDATTVLIVIVPVVVVALSIRSLAGIRRHRRLARSHRRARGARLVAVGSGVIGVVAVLSLAPVAEASSPTVALAANARLSGRGERRPLLRRHGHRRRHPAQPVRRPRPQGQDVRPHLTAGGGPGAGDVAEGVGGAPRRRDPAPRHPGQRG